MVLISIQCTDFESEKQALAADYLPEGANLTTFYTASDVDLSTLSELTKGVPGKDPLDGDGVRTKRTCVRVREGISRLEEILGDGNSPGDGKGSRGRGRGASSSRGGGDPSPKKQRRPAYRSQFTLKRKRRRRKQPEEGTTSLLCTYYVTCIYITCFECTAE